jgi:hypothetical protein
MVKEIKFFRKQAVKAERMARCTFDAEFSERFLNLANAYRAQADVLKAKKLKAKKKSGKKAAPTESDLFQMEAELADKQRLPELRTTEARQVSSVRNVQRAMKILNRKMMPAEPLLPAEKQCSSLITAKRAMRAT